MDSSDANDDAPQGSATGTSPFPHRLRVPCSRRVGGTPALCGAGGTEARNVAVVRDANDVSGAGATDTVADEDTFPGDASTCHAASLYAATIKSKFATLPAHMDLSKISARLLGHASPPEVATGNPRPQSVCPVCAMGRDSVRAIYLASLRCAYVCQ